MQTLSTDQQKEFLGMTSAPLVVHDVVEVTRKIDETHSKRKSRAFAIRIRGVLESVHQYCSVVDTFVQSEPKIAALVWGSLKFVILVS